MCLYIKKIKKKQSLLGRFELCLALLVCCLTSVAYGLEPEEVLVVANTNVEGSVKLARYYMEKRTIPVAHLLPLSLSKEETMSRKEFDTILADGVRQSIAKLQPNNRIAAVVLMYGVPLKVAPTQPGTEAMERVESYRIQQKELREQSPSDTKERQKNLGELIRELLNLNQRAAVDSELMLVKAGSYELESWIKNPYYLGNQGEEELLSKDQVLLVSRLDGPDVKTVYRIIDDTLYAEQKGLEGKAYFDARWQKPKPEKRLDGYRFYDFSLHKAAEVTEKRLPVVLDEQEDLFSEKSCPDAALYSGWYSLANYRDSFTWQRGAIGYHIASAECRTLRKPESNVWCKKMLEKGVAATIGPAHEPYVQGFPVPHVFFTYLVEGYMSLGEAYLVSLPYISWQMVLIGDPLYQPFAPFED